MGDLDRQLQELREEIGLLLRSARERRGYDQASVEDSVEISKGMISKLELGTSDALPGLPLAARLEAHLGIPRGHLRQLVIAGQIIRNFKRTDVSLKEIRSAVGTLNGG